MPNTADTATVNTPAQTASERQHDTLQAVLLDNENNKRPITQP